MTAAEQMRNLIGKLEVDGACQFCEGNCFTALLQGIPSHIARAFLERKVNMLATCQGGQNLDKLAIGYCFDDIVKELDMSKHVVV